ncbi:RNA ligase family protein [Variovorax sp. J22R115]|uniref:ATP-dependent DNA ligase n=1 Tax=Variovorax sp. J22R115 TaxID=3053509 RepID=UPI002574BC57|nr:RNA ligase family protein [Variovorax sp. J22R115]MDM0053559.1 RNA ligase family protein [Variovorax sp. J22R115]
MELHDYPPMLFIERPLAFDAAGWVWEIKLDGWRLTAKFGDGECELRTRGGANATRWFPEVTRSLADVRGGPYIIDGEVCVFDGAGRSDFDRLQARASRRRCVEGADLVGYAVFDLLVNHGVNVTMLTLMQRKAMLGELLDPCPDNVLAVGHFDSDIDRVFNEAVMQLNLEGLVAKRMNSVYLPGVRTRDWVKVKRPGAVPAEPSKH